jgi:hypothetical protein
MTTYMEILEDWGIADNFTEEDLWDAIGEADENKLDFYADGDLAEWL